METHTLRQINSIKCTSYQGLNLVIGKATSSLFQRYYMVYDILAFNGMKDFLIVLEIWDSSCASWNLTSGCGRTEIFINIAVYVNDLTIATRDPKSLMYVLENNYKFKLKRTGPI